MLEEIDFTHIEYLKTGNDRQRKAYSVLVELSLFKDLDTYSPILTGTIPIGIDIPSSDLDIICQCSDHEAFTNEITTLYAQKDQFQIRTNTINELISTIASFRVDGFEIEIFGQDCPTVQQNAYKHMMVEHAILNKKGDPFREEIIQLKKSGLKTEPAFVQLLGLDGNPYEALLKMKIT